MQFEMAIIHLSLGNTLREHSQGTQSEIIFSCRDFFEYCRFLMPLTHVRRCTKPRQLHRTLDSKIAINNGDYAQRHGVKDPGNTAKNTRNTSGIAIEMHLFFLAQIEAMHT
eukprot:743875-Pelagomonas_calceolata.AAC.2